MDGFEKSQKVKLDFKKDKYITIFDENSITLKVCVSKIIDSTGSTIYILH